MIYAERYGLDRQTVVWLHGFAGGHWTFRGFARELEGRCCSWCPDLPGHGFTTIRPPSFSGAIDAMEAWAEEREIRNAHLVGYSMGGRIGLTWALRYPERWRSVTLIGANPGLETERDRAERVKADELLAGQLLADGLENFLAQWDRQPLFGSSIPLTGSDPRVRFHDPAGLAWALRTMTVGHQPNLWDSLETLRQPLLLVTGSRDEKYRSIADRVVGKARRAVHYPVPGAHHRVHDERPGELAEILNKFWFDNISRRRNADESARA